MRWLNRVFFVAVVMLTALSSAQVRAGEAYGAKAIFMGEDEKMKVVATTSTNTNKVAATGKSDGKPGQAKPESARLAIMTWLRLVDETGGMKEVSPTRTFKSGERLRLNVKTNKDGYLYVVGMGSSGRAHVLFPRQGQSNYVKAGSVYETPDRNIRFDDKPGSEEIMVVLAQEPLPMVDIGNTKVRTKDTKSASDSAQWQRLAMASGAKDLVVEDDPGGAGAAPALYVAESQERATSRPKGTPLVVSLKLKHE